MTLLLALNGMDPAEWARGFARTASDLKIAIAPEVADPEAVTYALTWKPKPGYLKQFANLKVLFSAGAGVDHLTLDPELPDLPIVRVVHDDLTARMTEYVVMNVLMHLRQHLAYAQQQAERNWVQLPQPAADEVRVGILGLGTLGRDSADTLKRIGFQVSGWSRSRQNMEGVACFAGLEELPAFLAQTDILVCLLPLTEDTHGLINARFIDMLARDGVLGGPVLINAGRGGIQVEDDLVAALTDGRLKAASLDVFAPEPLRAESRLWELPNVILTPHVAADSAPGPLAAYVATMIAAYERGEPLRNLVNRKTGY